MCKEATCVTCRQQKINPIHNNNMVTKDHLTTAMEIAAADDPEADESQQQQEAGLVQTSKIKDKETSNFQLKIVRASSFGDFAGGGRKNKKNPDEEEEADLERGDNSHQPSSSTEETAKTQPSSPHTTTMSSTSSKKLIKKGKSSGTHVFFVPQQLEQDAKERHEQTNDQDPSHASASNYSYKPPAGSSNVSSSGADTSCENWRCWHFVSHRNLLAVIIILLGGAASGAFLALGISDAKDESETHFQQTAKDMVISIENAWHSYEIFGLWAHESCSQLGRNHSSAAHSTITAATIQDQLAMCSRDEFLNIYEQMLSMGLGIYSLQYATRVEPEYRAALQDETRRFMARDFPDYPYRGFTVLNEQYQLVPAPNTSFIYYPLHYAVPFEENIAVIDLDVYGHPGGAVIMDKVFDTWQPSLSPRRVIVQDRSVYSVFLTHPGSQSSVNSQPYSVVSLVVRVPDLLTWASRGLQSRRRNLFLYDITSQAEDGSIEPAFLGGVRLGGLAKSETVAEIKYEDLPHDEVYHYESDLKIVDRKWRVVVCSPEGSEAPNLSYIIMAGIFIFVAFLIVAWVLRRYLERMVMVNRVRSQAESEKATMALNQVKRERQLNEYLAHEVRNPLTSALAALSFVSANTRESVDKEETQRLLLNDIHIVESSLDYINDLLRSMLDINRAATGRIKIEETLTDINRDVLEPAAAILCMRGAKVKIETKCEPPDLMCSTDRLRLKQIVLNLAVNSTKFVEKGFIHIRAQVVKDSVQLIVEDSGPGIPPEKRNKLFESFQNSLDVLEQGTGLGLGICKNLADLMGGSLMLDQSFDSGVPDCPGARFVFDLRKAPTEMSAVGDICDMITAVSEDGGSRSGAEPASFEGAVFDQDASAALAEETARLNKMKPSSAGVVGGAQIKPSTPEFRDEMKLPENLRVLFVDDETILRRLFIRTIQKIAPNWEVTEASSGAAALSLTASNEYDLIFLDQYMPSIERPLLGTEVTRILRSNGLTSTIICGLSANDMREDFLEAGANWFMLKPFPCGQEPLKAEILRILVRGTSGSKTFISLPPDGDNARDDDSAKSSPAQNINNQEEEPIELV